MSDAPESFAATVRRLAAAQNVTQAELARRAGLHPVHLSALLSDPPRREPRLETAQRIARALGVSLAEFD